MKLNREHCLPVAILGHLKWMLLNVLIPVWQAKFRYPRVVKRLRNSVRKNKMKVLFVTGTTAKWKCQSLYDLMAASENYEPYVCQTICDVESSFSHAERVRHLDECKSYYVNRGMNYVEAYSRECEEWTDLNEFHADIVFYSQSWEVASVQLPHHVARTALTFMVPYFVANYGDFEMDIRGPFQRTLFAYCTLNKTWADIYKENVSAFMFAGRFCPVGHPALDPYHLKRGKCDSKGYVIYAPHWSIDCPGNENTENYSTFLQTGKMILAFAQAHTEMKWVFRPHPTLRTVLARTGVWSEDEIANYYNAWAEIGIFSHGGGYENLFMESSVLITDCGSFLTEYACTGNPIVHLVSSTAKIKPMKPSAELYATYYQVMSVENINNVLDEVVLRHRDPKREERLAKVRESGLLDNYAARNILNELDQLLGFEK